jgi:phosphohistidine phosphatase SixA
VLDVLLIRHAIAEDPDPDAWPDDLLRPLTERGVKRFRPAARGLKPADTVGSLAAVLLAGDPDRVRLLLKREAPCC